MKLLVLGGTGWLSGELARAAIAAGHDVTCAARGVTGSLPEGARFLKLDRSDAACNALLGGEFWEAAVDVSSQPGMVRRAADALADRCAHFVQVSSASAYARNDVIGADESAETLAAYEGDSWTDMAHYGAAKVACEQAVTAAFALERSACIRAGLIGGPGDATHRSGYWPLRFWKAQQAKQAVLVPDAPNQAAQVIDVRDLAAWLLHCAEARVTGTFNAVGESVQFADVIAASEAVAGFSGTTLAASEAWLVAQGVSYWAGPKSFPLWVPSATHAGFGSRSLQRARWAGLKLRPLIDTLRDTLAWEQSLNPQPPIRKAGLSDADEAELIALLQAQKSH
jgi:2'-hydroxyisoflavone reductase